MLGLRRPRLRAAVATLAALVLPVTMAGAVSGSAVADGAQTWTVLVGNETNDMAITGMWFLPQDIFIHPGDTVDWKANAAEIHTVTFLGKGQQPGDVLPFNPGNPQDTARTTNDTYDGTSYYNSGLLTTVPADGDPGPLPPGTTWYGDYQLSFPTAGNYDYLCLVHGMMMKGTVHVLPADVDLPFTQADYAHQAAEMARYVRMDGRQMLAHLRRQADRHHVIVGGDDGRAISMLFLRRKVVIHRGEKVTFTNPVINGNDHMGEPHTVTFGEERFGPDLMAPYGHPRHYRGGDLSSGEMLPGDSFTVTFRKPCTYPYICVLHDAMGMVGTVVVLPPRKR
jgi:plastocyanin